MAQRGERGPTIAGLPARALALALTVLPALAALAGCSSDSDGAGPERPTATSSSPTAPVTTAYPSGAPSGTTLTEPGTELGLGESATVAWQPRQGVVGALRISVDSIQPTTFKKSFRDWRVDRTTRTYAPYFVRATVTNVGQTDLGGAPVPLYGDSAAHALVEAAVFKETFKPCHPSALPTPFPAGGSTPVCLVYLVPARGQLLGAAFRPTEDFEPILWRPSAAVGSPTGSPTGSALPSTSGSPTGTPSS